MKSKLIELPWHQMVILFKTGWGSGLRKAVSRWYNSKDPMLVAEFVTRYTHVERWSHKDVFRLGHIKPENEGKV